MSYFVDRRMGCDGRTEFSTNMKYFDSIESATDYFDKCVENLYGEIIYYWCMTPVNEKQELLDSNTYIRYVLIEDRTDGRQESMSFKEVVETMHD